MQFVLLAVHLCFVINLGTYHSGQSKRVISVAVRDKYFVDLSGADTS